jgi:copper chaperone NosL
MRPGPRWLLVGAAVVVLATASACAQPVDANTPPTIRFGEDVCTRSGMIISEAAYAAAYRTTEGDVRPFDDIGEMVLHHRERHEQVASFWVHDLATHEWLRAETAYYVVSQSIRSPMGFGVAALGTEASAREHAARLTGRVQTFNELLADESLREGGGHHADGG